MATPHPKQPSHNFIDFTGQQFTRLTVLSRAPNIRGRVAWHVQCVCGNSLTVSSNALRRENTRSCGCLHKDAMISANKTHGMAGKRNTTPTYRSWQDMKKRCTNPRNVQFHDYGGRGITICERWHDFTLFLADMGERPPGQYTLERINNELGYFPANCRWATRKEQMNNTRQNVRLTYHGVTATVSEWAKRIGIPLPTLVTRLQRGWSIEQALITRPVRNIAKIHCLHGHEFTAENTKLNTRKGGGILRGCRTCERERRQRKKTMS